ncbi:hypothetical protein PLICRDRAFT_388297 [Plicaturopsis crispa FD-325 SS-3]|nr:hypothetical protein PLICRDRAFT_388297 [Plicaturopsis crispa FD-325 SS-3]
MAASPTAADTEPGPTQEKWAPTDEAPDAAMGPVADAEHSNGTTAPAEPPAQSQEPENSAEFRRDTSVGDASASGSKGDPTHREKQVKPNKVYVGGLPEHTRQEDLQSCFGKIGAIANIELKIGYGFVEFESREAAEEAVAKYHEGFFMGNKIRVELSHGGGRTAKYPGDPGACFKCGQLGHWARECPNHSVGTAPRRSSHHDAPLIDRIQPARSYPLPPPPPRDYPPYRDDFGPPGRFAPPPPPRERYGYDYPPLPPRDFRRPPPSPPRDYRDYPPVARPARDYDDVRMRGPPLPPPPRYERPSYYAPDIDGPPGLPPRGYGPPPPPRDPYDRYDRRAPPLDRYSSYPPPPPPPRARTPPGIPPPSRSRDLDYDRPPRDYPPPPAEFRGRPSTPPSRYADYPPRGSSAVASPPRYRGRRSLSPPPRASATPYDSAGYSGASRDGSYSGTGGGALPPRPPPRRASSRDYPARNGRDSRDAAEPIGSYGRP